MKTNNQLILPQTKDMACPQSIQENYVICKRIEKVQSCCCKFVKDKKTN